MTTRHTATDSPIGELTLVADGDALTGLYFPRHWYRPDDVELGPRVDGASDPVFAPTIRQLAGYFRGERTRFELTTAASGDAFQQKVWDLLDDIPYGETVTYSDLAARLGDPTLARDVGAAVGRNPLCVIVPCHRVVGKDGKLTGYAGGLTRKKLLLELEAPAEAKPAKLF
jgi:methylated-DNA-[protein]-cysteine S-methyltransferase